MRRIVPVVIADRRFKEMPESDDRIDQLARLLSVRSVYTEAIAVTENSMVDDALEMAKHHGDRVIFVGIPDGSGTAFAALAAALVSETINPGVPILLMDASTDRASFRDHYRDIRAKLPEILQDKTIRFSGGHDCGFMDYAMTSTKIRTIIRGADPAMVDFAGRAYSASRIIGNIVRFPDVPYLSAARLDIDEAVAACGFETETVTYSTKLPLLYDPWRPQRAGMPR